MTPDITSFFDDKTFTASFVVADPKGGFCAIIDPVLDFDPRNGRTSTHSADAIVAFIRSAGLTVEWILDTHIHADHLSAAQYLKGMVGGRVAVGDSVASVQRHFKSVFGLEAAFPTDGRQFDHLFVDGEVFRIGTMTATVLATPGHTAADISYLVGDAIFVGDSLFMPDYGTARADFPGGDATTLYRSIQRILALHAHTRIFVGHDYKAAGRDHFAWETTVADQRRTNIHVHDGVGEAEFVAMRRRRDATLGPPTLLIPSIQVNIRAGNLPPPDIDGRQYLKMPLNSL